MKFRQRSWGSERIGVGSARQIVSAVTDLIGLQVQETGRYLGLDLATGKPLLDAGANP